jgi:glutamate-1-semialdehyde 2,1-aminomutase
MGSSLHDKATKFLAGGVSHDSWRVDPHPIYFDSARGPKKWDVDGKEYIDYWMGHGALLLGHGHPRIIAALEKQIAGGTHFGGGSKLQIEWAEQICHMIPSAEKVRFVSSGTEAVQLAFRVARAYTGRSSIVRFDGHFHGWSDEGLAHYADFKHNGLHPDASEKVIVANPADISDLDTILQEDDVAAVILEPGGGSSGCLPYDQHLLEELSRLTRLRGVLLIFDEVVSGFRYSPGGVQSYCGVNADLVLLGKIVAGGLPGGAIAGNSEVMRVFGLGTLIGDRPVRVPHTGTFNGNPLAAAAGVATLQQLSDGKHQAHAEIIAEEITCRVNCLAEARDVDFRLFRNSSILHTVIGSVGLGIKPEPSFDAAILYQRYQHLHQRLRYLLLVEGVDMHPAHGWVSSSHDSLSIEATVAAYDRIFVLPEVASALASVNLNVSSNEIRL